MVQKIGDPLAWSAQTDGIAAIFDTEGQRPVRIEVKSAGQVDWSIVPREDGEFVGDPIYLTSTKGMDILSFTAFGPFGLVGDGGGSFIKTTDGEEQFYVALDEKSFTNIIERRATRNPEMERMMHLMNQNMQRNMNAQFDELNRRHAAQMESIAREHSGTIASEDAGNGSSGGSEDAGSVNSGAPGEVKPPSGGEPANGGA